MSVILVVEQEGRFVERIRDALSQDGWSVRAATSRAEALQIAGASRPTLVLVNIDLEDGPELLDGFARRNGGPGAVCLVPETRAAEAHGLGTRADAFLVKPFTDQEIQRLVKRCVAQLAAGGSEARPAAPTAPDPTQTSKLTSEEIFGDLLAEVEDGIGSPAPAAPPAAAPAAPKPPVPARPAAPSPPPAVAPRVEPPSTSPAPPAPAPPSPAPRPAPPVSADRGTDGDGEIARRLEQTLSGVLDPRQLAASRPAKPKRPTSVQSSEVDDLLSQTLSSLDLGSGASPKKTPPASRKPAAEEPIELAEVLGEVAATPKPTPPAPKPAPEPAPPLALEAEQSPSLEPASQLDVSPPVTEEAAPPVGGVSVAPDIAATQPIPVLKATGEGAEEFGQYTLLEKIAVGGMAEVWKARMRGMEGFQKTVAIKRILPHLTDNSAFVTMFIDEAKLAAQLNHPNITHIYDLGKISQDHYIAMEYVEGRNLRAILNAARRNDKDLPIGLALLIASRLASALDYAHRKKGFDDHELGLVHRDVSPQNVLISYEGDIKLCDFGIVKAASKASHTQTGALKGKLQYMSPEQASGHSVDSRSDLFSLGSLLFEMLTGRRLFEGDNEMSILDSVRQGQVQTPRELNAEVPEPVDQIVARALRKPLEDRYQSAGEIQQELESILYGLRPTPSQADLAAFMHELFGGDSLWANEQDDPTARSLSAPAEPAAAESPVSEAPVAAPVEATPIVVESPEPPVELVEPVEAAAAVPTPEVEDAPIAPPPSAPGPASAEQSVEALAPALDDELYDEDSRSGSRWWIWLLLAGALAAGAFFAATKFGVGGDPEGEPGLDPVPVAAPTAAPEQDVAPDGEAGAEDGASEPGEDQPTESADGETAEVAGDTASPEDAPAEGDPTRDMVEQMVNEELAKREARIRRELDAQQRQLEAQLAEAKAREEEQRKRLEDGQPEETEEGGEEPPARY